MNDKRKTAGLWLFDMAAGMALIAALIYATGWTYAYRYFQRFGLGLLELDIPHQYFLMYGFWVYKAWWWLMVLFYALALFLLLKLYGWSNDQGQNGVVAKQAQLVLVLVVFVLGAWLGGKQADDYYVTQQKQGFSAFPHVRVWPKQTRSEHKPLTRFYAEAPSGDYRLLLHSDRHVYLIKPPPDGKPARLAVSVLPLGQLEALRVLP